MYRTLEELISAHSEALKPAERLTVSAAAEKYRYLNNVGSYVGYWDNSVAPYLVEIQNELTSLEYTGLIFVGPARCGKSDIFFNWLTHTVVCDPADMMVVHMTQNTSRDWSLGDLRKVFRHTKEVGARVTPGRQSLNVHDISFTSGMRLLVKWPTVSELSGKTIPRVWLMDYDRMPLDIDKEGSPYFLGKKRTATFKRFGMTVAESSPGYFITDNKWRKPSAERPHEAPPSDGILSLYNRGDRRRWHWHCVSCTKGFEPDFSLIKYHDTKDAMEAAESCWMICPHCGQTYNYYRDEVAPGALELNAKGRWIKEGQALDEAGNVIGKGLRSDTASFWLKGPAAAFSDWKLLVYNYLKAEEEFQNTLSETALQTTVNVDQGLPYLKKASEVSRVPEELKDTATDLGERVVPEGVRFLVAAVDVQSNRFVVQVHGIGAFGDVWIVDRFELKKSDVRLDEDGERQWLRPGAYPEDWEVLIDAVLEKTYPLRGDEKREMQIKATFCDSGGKAGVTKNAYDFWRWLRDEDPEGRNLHKRFQLVKGSSLKSAPRVQISYPDSDRKDRNAGARGEIPVLFLNTDLVKDQADKMLDRKTPGGGKINFPEWLPDWFYVELTVERKTLKGWENPRALRNESWDLLVYCLAGCLSRHINLEMINWDEPPTWALPWRKNSLIFDKQNAKRFASESKSEYNLAELAKRMA